jgi:hypothetical protein
VATAGAGKNGGSRRKQRQQRGQTTINQKAAAIAAGTAIERTETFTSWTQTQLTTQINAKKRDPIKIKTFSLGAERRTRPSPLFL